MQAAHVHVAGTRRGDQRGRSGVGAADAAEDADTLAIELEIGSDLEFEGRETGVDFFLDFLG